MSLKEHIVFTIHVRHVGINQSKALGKTNSFTHTANVLRANYKLQLKQKNGKQ